MFWRVSGFAQPSPVEAALDRPNCTLENLLAEDDLIQVGTSAILLPALQCLLTMVTIQCRGDSRLPWSHAGSQVAELEGAGVSDQARVRDWPGAASGCARAARCRPAAAAAAALCSMRGAPTWDPMSDLVHGCQLASLRLNAMHASYPR